MITLFVGLAMAAPPDGVDPDDFLHWEKAADRALDGPEGCWELTGAVRIDAGMHSPGTAIVRGDTYRLSGEGTWEGRIDDGQWTRFVYRWTTMRGAEMSAPIYPLIGRIEQSVVENQTPDDVPVEGDGDLTIDLQLDEDEGGSEAINVFHQLVDNWEPAGSTTVSEWSEELSAIRLVQDIPLLDKVNPPVVTVISTFPGGGAHPTEIDASFPKRIKLGTWPMKVTLMDTQFHLRQQPVGNQVLPQVEGFTLMAGILGFTLGWEQQITYATAQACTSEG